MIKKLQDNKYFKIAVFIVVLLIPVIYSFFYLKSYWNPYGHLDDIKVGIVNLDKGNEGENRGEEFVKELKDSKTFNFVDVENSDDATKGLGNDEYYAVITIPSDFTETLNSAKTDNKRISTITYTPNKRKNYLSSQILNSALKSVELKLESKVSREVTKTLSDSLKDVPDDLKKIADGADKLDEGADSLNNGLQTLSEGVQTLDNKYTDFNNGINSAYSGSESLANGIGQVNDGLDSLASGSSKLEEGINQVNSGAEVLNEKGTQGIEALSNGINKLDEGAGEVSTGVSSYVDGTEQLANGVSAYVDGVNSLNQNKTAILNVVIQMSKVDSNLETLAGQAQAILDAENSANLNAKGNALKTGANKLVAKENGMTLGDKLKYGASSLKSGTSELKNKASGLGDITAGISKLRNGLSQVGTGITTLKNGTEALRDGSGKVKEGADSLEGGLKILNDSSAQVKDALVKLDDGAKQAVEGTSKLKDGTGEFKKEINDGLDTANEEIKKLDGIESYVEDPVEFKEESYGEVDSYGVAFAPLFIAIGLWVGALMCYVVLYYDQRHRFGVLDHDSKIHKILQNMIYLGIGAVDGIITGVLLKVSLGYSVVNMPIYLFVCMLVGLLFMEVIQFLIKNFGDFGKFIALIILVLQLAASGGTFPVETIDNSFKAFTSILPMTYAIRAFRDTLIYTDHSLLLKNIIILIGIFVGILIIQSAIDLFKISREKIHNKIENKKTVKE